MLAVGFNLCLPGVQADEVFPQTFAHNVTGIEIATSSELSEQFCRRWALSEARFFAMARDPQSGLTYDGWDLDPRTGQPSRPRKVSAASKESLDLAILTKALLGDPFLALVVSPHDPTQAPLVALDILAKKIKAYQIYLQDYPGFSGYLGWFVSGPRAHPATGWSKAFPTLDLGEMLWALKATHYALKTSQIQKSQRLAKAYEDYLLVLTTHARQALYNHELGAVRGRVEVSDPRSSVSTFSGNRVIRGEHGVHEGQMIVAFMTLYGGLTVQESDNVWAKIEMKRLEHPLGTTWEGFWGSPHEEWAYLFLPIRDLPRYRDLFRIREKIRTYNAVCRGYPGLAASAHHPGGDGYMSAAGIEGVGSQVLQFQDTYTPYGAFPLMLEFSGKSAGDYGLVWFHNMLLGPRMQGPFGVGEAGDNFGSKSAPVKTIDGSFTTLLAHSGGLASLTRAMLEEDGRYQTFVDMLKREYGEAFGRDPLREPPGFGWPAGPAPSRLSPYSP